MICSSEKRFFTSNLLGIGNWTPNRCATQTRGTSKPPSCWRTWWRRWGAARRAHCAVRCGRRCGR
ncbi:hypothetical protein EYR05_06415 [Xanthomonas oryzae pv. oryzae]|nr:hypothetical protein EYR05_06415 [Xanthomonas oryzae pv. oryzae]